MKAGPIKVWWEEKPQPEHIKVTAISNAEVLQYMEQEDLVVTKVEPHVYAANSPMEGSEAFDLCAVRYYENGRLRIEAFPMYEFFCERNGSRLEDCIHGHRREVTVGEALEMGLEYEDWGGLDTEDPEITNAAAASVARRGYSKDGDDTNGPDILNKKILLSEAYARYDLDGDGVSELYCFYLGGTAYKYLAHEQIEDYAISLDAAAPYSFSRAARCSPNSRTLACTDRLALAIRFWSSS